MIIEDTKGAFPSYDALLMVSPEAAQDQKLIDTLSPLIGAISVDQMREANLAVDRLDDKQSPRDAAAALATAIGL